MVRTSRTLKNREIQCNKKEEDWDAPRRAMSRAPARVSRVHGVLPFAEIWTRAKLPKRSRHVWKLSCAASIWLKSDGLHMETEPPQQRQRGTEKLSPQRNPKTTRHSPVWFAHARRRTARHKHTRTRKLRQRFRLKFKAATSWSSKISSRRSRRFHPLTVWTSRN